MATDGNREGEAIARLIINLSENDEKPLKRLWINSLEKEEINAAIRGLNYLKEIKKSEDKVSEGINFCEIKD
ncbi:hypothetical protein ACMHYK_16010 [Candidatus Enterenecus avicola]|uniref:hypothetical protein n=1 Tax=Enterococcus casseliflavus TaxID=37734 RepID=UPI003AEAA9C4